MTERVTPSHSEVDLQHPRRILTPHENEDELRERIQTNKQSMAPEDRHFLTNLYHSGFMRVYREALTTAKDQQIDMQTKTMAAINGLTLDRAAVLANKFNFIDWLHQQQDLPIHAPVQVLYSPQSEQDTQNYQAQLQKAFTSGSATLRCKPLQGVRGRGQKVVRSAEEATRFLQRTKEPYIVQENMEDIRYSRYIAYFDKKDTLWRFAEVQKPDTEKKFPNPPADQEMLARLDSAIMPLMDRIREEFGDSVKLFCFDFGIPKQAEGPISVFEFQMPYLMLGYPLTAPHGVKNYMRFHKLVAQEQGKEFIERFKAVKTKQVASLPTEPIPSQQ